MKRTMLTAVAACAAITLSAAVTRAVEAPAKDQPKQYAITSWGDIILCYGPGTDPAMDTPQALENMIRHWKGRGYNGVYMRTDLGQVKPLIRRNPITATTQASAGTGNSDPRLSPMYKYIDRVMSGFDFHTIGEQLSAKHGFEWWAWHPHVYSDGAPEWAGGPGRIWPWTYVYTHVLDHPEIVTVDRAGNKYWMVREFAYPIARESKVAEFVHMARAFGVKRFISCMRSETTQLQAAPVKADQYGFNQPVVDDMKRLHGIDIMTDPRFDVNLASFDPKDPAVQKWHVLRGSYVTQYHRELRTSLREVDPEIEIAVTLAGERVGPPLGNWITDWRTWVDEGLVDAIITPVTFEASLIHDAVEKGYLTHNREDIGVASHETIRDYIARSKHPQIQVISSNAPPYLFPAPPEGAHGWRIDAWYSAYHLAWYQRWWKQCVKDVEELGHIRFIHQNFDDFPVGGIGHAGGWGDARYDPARRSSPGGWLTLGDGADAKPTAIEAVARGNAGRSIRLTSAGDGAPSPLIGMHRSFPDRSGIYTTVDNAITNGKAVFEFWVYRESEQSGISAHLQDKDTDGDVAIKIAPGTGKVSCAIAKNGGDFAWKEAAFTVPVKQWQRFAIEVDLDHRVYSGRTGEGTDATLLWREVGIAHPPPRVIEHFNVGLPIEVPSYKMFTQVQFVPQGLAGAVTHVDDVAVNWTPTLHYTKPRPKAFFHDDFERHAVDGPINSARTHRGGMWTSSGDAGAGAFRVTNDTSFGEGVKALLATAGGTVVAKGEPLRHIPNSHITVDLDVFVRSDKDYPHVMPDPTTTSNHRATVGLRRKGSSDYAAAAIASGGTWWLWDGARFVDSKTRVTYDVWNHLQIAVDAPSGAYRTVVQPVGEMPTLVGAARLGETIVINSDLEFFIQTSDTENHLSLYDNVLVTAGSRP